MMMLMAAAVAAVMMMMIVAVMMAVMTALARFHLALLQTEMKRQWLGGRKERGGVGGLKGNSVFFLPRSTPPCFPECQRLKERHLVGPEASADLPSLNLP